MRFVWFVLVACALASGSACGRSPNDPSRSLTGVWTARGAGHTGLSYTLRLQQSGDTISGTACGYDGGFVLFSNAPVHGDYPRVSFVITPASTGICCDHFAGQAFSGRQDDTHDIVGSFLGGGADLRFVRGAAAFC